MEYHVFKKPKKLKSGKTVHRWYYYYLDENEEPQGKPCGIEDFSLKSLRMWGNKSPAPPV
jgi:hypothetical protein